MGMAASQARLLAITARIHDVEYQAQSIQNAKVQLATKSDQVYNDYLEALDATTLTARNIDGENVVVNFNNLCGKNAINVQGNSRYALYNERGRLIVQDAFLEAYENYMEEEGVDDPYIFAMYMMGVENGSDIAIEDVQDARDEVLSNSSDSTFDSQIKGMKKIIQKYAEDDEVADFELDELMDVASIFENYICEEFLDEDDEGNIPLASQEKLQKDRENYQKYVDEIHFKLFSKYAPQIQQVANGDMDEEDIDLTSLDIGNDFDYDTFNYYVRMYQLMKQAGGAVAISEYDGFNGDASNDGDWLQGMIKSGQITIDLVSFSTKDGTITKSNSGVSSDTYLNYTASSQVDKTKLAKAEAEYEHKMKDINTKDKRFDMDLSKLETERTALKTEYESVKKVIEDNIERTFGIFS